MQQAPGAGIIKKLSIYIVAGLLLLVTGLGVALRLAADPERIGAQLIARMQLATGRKVSLDAPPAVDLALQPRLRLSGLTVGEPLDGSKPGSGPLLRLGALDARLDAAALLSGALRFPSVRATGLHLDLTTLAQATTDSVQSTQGQLSLEVQSLAVADLSIVHAAPGGEPVTLRLDRFDAERTAPGALRYAALGQLGGQALSVSGEVRPESDHLALARPLTGRLTATLDDGRLELEGRLGSLVPLADVALSAALSLGRGPLAGLTVAATLRGNLERLSVAQITTATNGASQATTTAAAPRTATGAATAAAMGLSGELVVTALTSPPTVRGILRADHLHLAPSQDDGTQALELPPPLPVDAQIDLQIVRVTGLQPALEAVRARLTLHGDRLSLDDLEARAAGGRVTGRIAMQGRAAGLQVSGQVEARGLDVGQLPVPAEIHGQLSGALDTELALTASGASSRDWRRTASGTVRAMLRSGRIKARSAERLIGGVRTLFDLLSGDGSEWLQLNCAAADFEVDAGVARSRLLVLDSEYASVVGEGSVNLDTEQIAFLVSPRPKSATLNLAVPVRIAGHWSAPTFAVDEAAAARRVGGLLAGALVFPPAVIAAFVDLGYADSGCVGGAVLKQADSGKALLDRTADAVGRTAGDAARGAGKAAESAGDLAVKAGKATGNAAAQLAEDVGEGLESAAKKAADTVGKLFGN